MRPTMITACLALLLPFAATAQNAATATPPRPAADGASLAYTCRGCHGIAGYKNAYPSYRVPKLVGQSEIYLKNALTEYRQGKRQHPTMQAQAQSFSEQDIAAIAAYLASLKTQ
ncbi:cytochrome c [Lysobacter pythonis]|uniref:Cytochrome c n=1 Tax=Solilutibacter pythonis TaxID=2483112 RepID=A0A3M2HZ36_9GAMM|nr:cytochrome c [Lysobacter pythonis]RMH94986.1 cytochrome c [Lysobacter pythonis]